jgi:hypothetical protein
MMTERVPAGLAEVVKLYAWVMTTCEENVMFAQSAVKVAGIPPPETIVPQNREIFLPAVVDPLPPSKRNWLSEFRTPGDVCSSGERKVAKDIL